MHKRIAGLLLTNHYTLLKDIAFSISAIPLLLHTLAQKMKFSIKDFFSKFNQICSVLPMWSHLLQKSLMENFIFCAVISAKTFILHFLNSCPMTLFHHFSVTSDPAGALVFLFFFFEVRFHK